MQLITESKILLQWGRQTFIQIIRETENNQEDLQRRVTGCSSISYNED